MSNEQKELLNEVYEDALMEYGFESLPSTPEGTWFETIETFIHKCKTDPEFSEKWGLKIEERELSLNDRILEFAKRDLDASEFRRGGDYGTVIPEEKTLKVLDRHNIPTKVITITYNDKKIESYK